MLSGSECFSAECNLTAEEIADLAKKTAVLTKLVKLAKAVDAFITRPTPRLTAWIAQTEAFLAISNTPDESCPGEVLNEIEVQTNSGREQIELAQIGAIPAIPAPPRYYAVINSPGLSWADAKLAAEALDGLADGWHLATITSGAEQAIINDMLPDPTLFPAEGPLNSTGLEGNNKVKQLSRVASGSGSTAKACFGTARNLMARTGILASITTGEML